MNYSDFLIRLDALAAQGIDVSQFPATVPAIVDAAEQRIYREIDFLSTTTRDESLALTIATRELLFTANAPFVTLASLNVITAGSRSSLQPVSRDLLDAVYGAPVTLGQPQWFAPLDGLTVLVGPYPDQAYQMEVVGTVRPAPLYTLGPTGTTFVSLNLPDLFFAAAMAFVSTQTGAKVGIEAPNGGWEETYQLAKESAVMEEARKKFQSAGWTSLSAPSAATPTR